MNARPPEPNTDDMAEALRARLGQRQDQPAAPAPVPPAAEPGDDDGWDVDVEPIAAPRRSVGRAGAGKVNRLVYAPEDTMDALAQLARDVFHGTQGRIKQWQVIDYVVRQGLKPGSVKRFLARNAPDLPIDPDQYGPGRGQ